MSTSRTPKRRKVSHPAPHDPEPGTPSPLTRNQTPRHDEEWSSKSRSDQHRNGEATSSAVKSARRNASKKTSTAEARSTPMARLTGSEKSVAPGSLRAGPMRKRKTADVQDDGEETRSEQQAAPTLASSTSLNQSNSVNEEDHSTSNYHQTVLGDHGDISEDTTDDSGEDEWMDELELDTSKDGPDQQDTRNAEHAISFLPTRAAFIKQKTRAIEDPFDESDPGLFRIRRFALGRLVNASSAAPNNADAKNSIGLASSFDGSSIDATANDIASAAVNPHDGLADEATRPEEAADNVDEALGEQIRIRQLLEQTVVYGEGNSMVIVGPRGAGKTAAVESALLQLQRTHEDAFVTVRLNGFALTDDKLALREIWRQLSVQTGQRATVLNYADTLATLLSLLDLEHDPDSGGGLEDGSAALEEEQKRKKAVVFVLNEFEQFTFHSRQTLLYNLFDIAQSRKAPVAVIGTTTRVDAVSNLEKRVKSRFSQRIVFVSALKSLSAFQAACLRCCTVASDQLQEIDKGLRVRWNDAVSRLLDEQPVSDQIRQIYATSRCLPTAFSFLYPLVSSLRLPPSPGSPQPTLPADRPSGLQKTQTNTPRASASKTRSRDMASVLPPDNCLWILCRLPSLHLALLICAARLEQSSFGMAYDEYCQLSARSRAFGAGSVPAAIGGRVVSRTPARAAWLDLKRYGLLVPVVGFGGTQAAVNLADADLCRADVELAEIRAAVGTALEPGMVSWLTITA